MQVILFHNVSDFSMKITLAHGQLAITVTLSEEMRNQISGLLGEYKFNRRTNCLYGTMLLQSKTVFIFQGTLMAIWKMISLHLTILFYLTMLQMRRYSTVLEKNVIISLLSEIPKWKLDPSPEYLALQTLSYILYYRENQQKRKHV